MQPTCQKYCLQNMLTIISFPSPSYRPDQAPKYSIESLTLWFFVHKNSLPIYINVYLRKGEYFFSFQSSIWRPCSNHACAVLESGVKDVMYPLVVCGLCVARVLSPTKRLGTRRNFHDNKLSSNTGKQLEAILQSIRQKS